MADIERDEIPMLSAAQGQSSGDFGDPRFRALTSRTRSASIPIPSSSSSSYQDLAYPVGYTGPLHSERNTAFSTMSGPIYGAPRPETLSVKDQNDWPENTCAGKNEHLLTSGQLGMCNDPYCTTCPTFYKSKEAERETAKSSGISDRFHNAFYGGAKRWAKGSLSYISSYMPGVMNPHAKVVRWWNQFFVISCFIAAVVDPLFSSLPKVQLDNKCILLNATMTTTIVVLRTVTDFIYFLHILLQFRLAFIAPELREFGAGDLVDDPKEIVLNYVRGYLFIDLFVALPLPLIMVLIVLPRYYGSSAANYAKNRLCVVVLIQYVPRLYRLLPMLSGFSPTGFIFESVWPNFIMNLLMFVSSGNVAGSYWYLFGLQRVSLCLQDACHPIGMCEFLDCGHGNKIDEFRANVTWKNWTGNARAMNCFSEDGFDYGIYRKAVNLTTKDSIVMRYVYSLFWGFQQISTLAGNQQPSYLFGEVVFTMLGLVLFALFMGNMQNFLQSHGKRRLEMSLRRHDVELWMRHRRLPEELRKRVRQSEWHNWAATGGVDEKMLLENLTEDIQRDIRRHIFKFVKNVRIFRKMEDPFLDAICEKLRQKTYIKGRKILNRGHLIKEMIFIVRGKMHSEGEGGVTGLSEGDACGEELLAWCLENFSMNKGVAGQRLHSLRTVECLIIVEVFALPAVDLEEVTRHFARYLRSARVQGAISYASPYWRGLAATRIQVAWRYRKKCLTRANTSQSTLPQVNNNIHYWTT